MKKHVSRLLQPGVIWYSIVLLAFSAAAAALDQFYLAGAELLVTIVVFAVSRARFAHRKRALIEYVQSATDSVGVSVHAGSPFPMAVMHLPEAEIVWGNPDFYAITGLTDGKTVDMDMYDPKIVDFSITSDDGSTDYDFTGYGLKVSATTINGNGNDGRTDASEYYTFSEDKVLDVDEIPALTEGIDDAGEPEV